MIVIRNEKDASAVLDKTVREHIRQRAMSLAVDLDPKSIGEIDKAVRPQARKRDAHDLKRVEPGALQRMAPGNPFDERTIEGCVVRHDVALADELDEPKHGRLGTRLAGEHLIGDAGELGYLQRHRDEWVDKRRERRDDLGPFENRCGNFDDAVAFRIVAGGLDVDYGNLVVKTEHGRPSTFSKRPIGRLDVFIRSGDEEC